MQLKALGDNGIDLELTVWIHDAELGQTNLRSDVLMHAWRAFRAANIAIPYPQREVRFSNGSPAQAPIDLLKPANKA